MVFRAPQIRRQLLPAWLAPIVRVGRVWRCGVALRLAQLGQQRGFVLGAGLFEQAVAARRSAPRSSRRTSSA
jgi:hypothetical protein